MNFAPQPKPDFNELWESYQRLPEGIRAEILNGSIQVQPQPRAKHQRGSARLNLAIGSRYDDTFIDDGGWVFMYEPELQFIKQDAVLVPDIAGWRRENLPNIPDDYRFLPRPDWVCEILSPSTARQDTGEKLKLYQAAIIPWYWVVDLDNDQIQSLSHNGEQYDVDGISTSAKPIALKPFDSLVISPGDLS